MVSFLYRMPAGIPGAVSRKENYTSEAQYIDATNAATYPLQFGQPVKTVAGLMQALAVGDATSLVTGFMERVYPAGASQSPLGTSVAPTSGLMTRLKRGYMTVFLAYGTAAKDAPVFFRTTAATSPARPALQIEAAYDAAATATANGGNTGNGTMSAVTVVSPAITGTYTVTFTAATKFSVFDPNGYELPGGTTGTAYSAEGIGFTITVGGTAFVAGDGFTIANVVRAGQITGAYFTGPADAAGNVEIAYRI